HVPFWLKEVSVMRSRRFLPPSHRYRKMRKEFDGTEEKGRAPKHLDGKLVSELVKNIKVVFGKKVPKGKETTKKRKKTTESDDQRKEPVVTRKMKLGSRRFRFSLSTCPTGRT